jgi:asparagine synthase (glutamine-hydrolysing)
MCGICGHIGVDDPALIGRMTDALAHRGPDDAGHFRCGHVALGNRRLSIIDLPGGHQPMSTPDGRFTIVFNGEIYNHAEIRERLVASGVQFHSRCDTEVLLNLIATKGIAALDELNGMFAFAIYDRQREELLLARDRIGIKPLYYLEQPGKLLFASEMKSLVCYRDWSPTLNPSALRDALQLRYVRGAHTMHREVMRLPAGHYLRCRAGRVEIQRYWSLPAASGPFDRTEDEYVEEFAALLKASVRRRLMSDVPFGAYLSGGLDSSTIVALMAQLGGAPVRTFAVGFGDNADELANAADVARELGCTHSEIRCGADDLSLLPEIVRHLDEPMGDPIILPMYQLARAAQQHVKVILTGEGGDEILGGYLFHTVMSLGERYRRAVPRWVRAHVMKPLVAAAPAGMLNKAFAYPAYLGERGKRKVLDYLDLLEPGDMRAAYAHLIALFDEHELETLFEPEFAAEVGARGASTISNSSVNGEPYLHRLLRLQYEHWLPENMLLRQDKLSMAHSIEARVPFLDHTLVEFTQRVPPNLKVRRLTGKYLLRRAAARILPPAVANRPKRPFYMPIERYFRSPVFKEMVGDLLSETAIRKRGIFRPQAIAALVARMHEREFLYVKQVFALLVLQLWFREFLDRKAA